MSSNTKPGVLKSHQSGWNDTKHMHNEMRRLRRFVPQSKAQALLITVLSSSGAWCSVESIYIYRMLHNFFVLFDDLANSNSRDQSEVNKNTRLSHNGSAQFEYGTIVHSAIAWSYPCVAVSCLCEYRHCVEAFVIDWANGFENQMRFHETFQRTRTHLRMEPL